MKWFDSLSAGKQHTDFFANRVTNYSKGVQDWDANHILKFMENNALQVDYSNWEAENNTQNGWMKFL